MELSPARMAARWFSWVAQGIGSAKLSFAGAEGYAGAVTSSKKAGSVISGNLLESQDLQASAIRDSAPILKAETVEFTYPMSIGNYNKIRANPYGLIEFERSGIVEQGWIKEVEFDFTQFKAKFTLFPRR